MPLIAFNFERKPILLEKQKCAYKCSAFIAIEEWMILGNTMRIGSGDFRERAVIAACGAMTAELGRASVAHGPSGKRRVTREQQHHMSVQNLTDRRLETQRLHISLGEIARTLLGVSPKNSRGRRTAQPASRMQSMYGCSGVPSCNGPYSYLIYKQPGLPTTARCFSLASDLRTGSWIWRAVQ